MTDRQLIEAYAGARDLQAFGLFVERHQSALLSFASAFLRDDTLAQDIVQETFLRAARDPNRILKCVPGGTGERNWLLKVARDLSVDSLRRKASERRVVGEMAAVQETSAPAPDAVAEGQEQAAQMRAAIENLKPRLRELLLLKVREKKSYKEIAEITGLSVTNVGFLLHQAMQALTEKMKESGE